MEVLTVNQNEDTQFIFYINNFEPLTGYQLKMQIRDEAKALMGAFDLVVTSDTSFIATLTHGASALIPAGEYMTDVLAISLAKHVYITPPMKLVVVDRITLPV